MATKKKTVKIKSVDQLSKPVNYKQVRCVNPFPSSTRLDSKYISAQVHELKHVAKEFGIDLIIVSLIHNLMSRNSKKVVRANLYGALAMMGYKRSA